MKLRLWSRVVVVGTAVASSFHPGTCVRRALLASILDHAQPSTIRRKEMGALTCLRISWLPVATATKLDMLSTVDLPRVNFVEKFKNKLYWVSGLRTVSLWLDPEGELVLVCALPYKQTK